MQNKFLHIILNKPYDSPIKTLHSITNITIIKEFIQNLLIKAYNSNHPNPFVKSTGNYETTNIPLKIRTKLLKHALTHKTIHYIKNTLKHSRFFETFFLQLTHTCIIHKSNKVKLTS